MKLEGICIVSKKGGGNEILEQKDRFVEALAGVNNCHYPEKTMLPYQEGSYPTLEIGKSPLVIQGILRGCENIINQCIKTNTPFFYLDHAYFGATRHYKGSPDQLLYRVNYCNTNTAEILDLSTKDYTRIQKYKPIEIKPLRKDKSTNHILVFPPTKASARAFKVQRDWETFIEKKLSKYSKRKIIFRSKDCEIPLEEQLENCHATVGLNSTACIHSVLAGVPTFVPNFSPAFQVGNYEMSMIENPIFPNQVLLNRWIDSLLATQFTLSEIQNGVALEAITRLYGVNL